MLHSMFATPYYKTKIESKKYNKSKIIKQITQNYKIDPNRNVWLGDSKLHHAYNDENNPKFKQISYDSLLPLYNEKILEFLTLYFDVPVEYRFYIVNYTCVTSGNYMGMHNHPGTCFSGIHYLKFNKDKHPPTEYHNPTDWAFYVETFFPEPMRAAHTNPIKHNWIKQSYKLDVEEDDFVITPAVLRHSVPHSNSDELRMAIIFHIDILPYNATQENN